MTEGFRGNVQILTAESAPTSRIPPVLLRSAQARRASWAAAVWSLAITTAVLLLVSMVITAFVSTTLLASRDPPPAAVGRSAPAFSQRNRSSFLKAVPKRGARTCDSAACMDQARLLLRQINTSRDPCDDFYAYVCEDWAVTRPLPPGAERLSMDTILADGYAELLAWGLRENATKFPALRFLLDNCMHPQPTLFPELHAMFLEAIRLRPWMTRMSSRRTPSAIQVSHQLAAAFRELGVDALFRPFVALDSAGAKRFVGLGEPSTVLLSGPLEKKEYEVVRRSFASLLAFFKNYTDTDVLQFEERLALMLSHPQLDTQALINGTMVKVRELPFLPNIEWTNFLQGVFGKGLRPVTVKTYVKLSSPDYLVRLTRSDLLRFASELIGYLLFRVTLALSPLLDDQAARDHLASLNFARHPEFPQVLPQAQYCLRLLDRFEPNLPLYVSRHLATSLLGGEGAVADMVSTLRSSFFESLQARLGPMSSILEAHLRDKLNAVSWEPLRPPALDTDAIRAAYIDGIYTRNPTFSSPQFFYTWFRKILEKKLMSRMNPRASAAGYPGWTQGFLSAESRLPPPYDRLEIPLPVFDFFLNEDTALRPLQLVRAAPKIYRSLIRAVYHWAFNFEHANGDDRESGGGSLTWSWDQLRICLERQYAALAWAERRMQLDATRTSWSDLWDNLALRPAMDAFLLFAHRLNPDYRVALLDHWDASQLFFVYYAANYCENSNRRFLSKMAAQGPHSPAWFRVNGPLRNMPEFALAFGCKPGSFMNPLKRCVLHQ